MYPKGACRLISLVNLINSLKWYFNVEINALTYLNKMYIYSNMNRICSFVLNRCSLMFSFEVLLQQEMKEIDKNVPMYIWTTITTQFYFPENNRVIRQLRRKLW